MNKALRDVADAAVDPPAFTVGDEFQGAFTSVGLAIDAALSLRLAVAPEIDVRFGIGWGEVTMLDEAAGIQDGPGWWAAREAIEWTATAQRQPGLALVRTSFRAARAGQDRRRRDQRRADLSGPPAWIVGRPIDTDCEGTVEEPDQKGHRRGGRHQPVGGVAARRPRRPRPDRVGVGVPAERAVSAVAVMLIAMVSPMRSGGVTRWRVDRACDRCPSWWWPARRWPGCGISATFPFW